MTAPRLALRGIVKRFGPIEALQGADFTLASGEFHALLGENGAGKSTLMHIAAGLLQPDAGTVVVDGTPRTFRSPRDARRAGIGMVHQHFTSIPALTVAENIALTAGWSVEPRQVRRRVAELVERIGLPLDPDAPAGALSVALKQRLEIVKALAAHTTILLLDEPTAVLAPTEAAELLRRMRDFARSGGAVVLITHKLEEALAATDRVTVLRRGEVTLTAPTSEQTAVSLAQAMIGADLPAPPARRAAEAGAVLVQAEALEVARESGYGVAVRGASFEVRAGEVVGVAAVEGNGERELLRAVAGLLEPLRGILHAAEPTAFIPEDRTTEGLIGEFTLTENLVLALGRDAQWVRGHLVDWRLARARAAEVVTGFGIRASSPDIRARALSGGNQQKLVVAEALERKPQVLVAENPTRGLDLAATHDVHERLRQAATGGAAVLLYSSDLDEVIALADRIVVMAGGRLTPAPHGASRAEIGAMMLDMKKRAG
ncbi:MAG: ABC transporter ATP-binding protein [Gemmatimonadota bacterium]